MAACVPMLENGPSTLLNEVYNQEKTKKAMVCMNSGNATTDNSIHVFVENPDFALTDNTLGNVFIVDSDHNKAQLDSNSIKLKWLDQETIEILYNSKLRVFKRESKIDRVKVTYKKK